MLSQGVKDFKIGGRLQFNCYFETPPPLPLLGLIMGPGLLEVGINI